jgi:uncharacterized membrane protein
LSGNSDADETTKTVIRIIREKKPDSVNQLVVLVKDKLQLSEKQALDLIVEMQSQGKIKLEKQRLPISLELSSYLRTSQTLWYWITLAMALLTVVVVFTIPENVQPWSYLRNVLGVIFVLWPPGYSIIKALFPVNVPFKTSKESFDTLERIVLSIGMSVVIVPLVGLVLNYTPWGIRLAPIVLSLFAFTCIFATVAVIREYQTKMKMQR